MTSVDLPPFSDWVTPERVVLPAITDGGAISCELEVNPNGLQLHLSSTSLPPIAPVSLSQERTAIAAVWVREISWQVRQLLRRNLDVYVAIREKTSRRSVIRGLGEIPALGEMVRPLFSDFRSREELRPFQRDGVAWLMTHKRGILADDMGLGKTLQILEATRQRIHAGEIRTAVILCPRTLVGTWVAEASRWAPELTLAASTSWTHDTETLWDLARGRVHLLVIHYDLLRSLDEQELGAKDIRLLVLDEAHRVRKTGTATTNAVRHVAADSVWAVTGTPIERDTEDLATLLSIVEPSRFSPADHRLGPAAIRSFAQPRTLRRRKQDVLADLPHVTEICHYVDLLPTQSAAYRAKLAERSTHQGRKGEMLAAIGNLLSICDAEPSTGESAKLEHLAEQLESIAAVHEKAVIFSYKLFPLDVLPEVLEANGIQSVRIDGRMSIDERNASLQRFRTDQNVTALLASSRVASEGLTLTEANHAFFVNRWWNPSSNDQARDRIVRIGQAKPVTIHTYTTRDTIEERLEQILSTKRDIVENVIESLALGPSLIDDAANLEALLTDASTSDTRSG